MTSDVAITVAKTALFENHAKLQLILKSSMPLDSHRPFLRSISDRLESTCQHLERHGAATEHEEIYLPLFEAHCAIAQAIGTKPIRRAGLEVAAAKRDDLADLLAAVPS